VAVWGANVSYLGDLIKIGLMMMHGPGMLGQAESLLSWRRGELCELQLGIEGKAAAWT
jgi:hypothetical protein